MSKKIVGVTVGTPIKPSVIEQKIKPVKSINGILPDDDGNVGVDITTSVRLAELSGGHLSIIIPVQNGTITTYKETNGKIEAHSTATGSSYIKCPKYLLMHFPDDAARAYVYFYDRVGDEYVPNWDVISQTTSSSVKNYLSRSNAAPYLFEIPDGVYMQIGKAAGEVEFFGWDGEPFGMPLSADYNYPKYSGEADVFNTDGSYGVTIPGDAEYAIAHDGCKIWVVNGYIGDTATLVFSSVAKSFVKLPEGYDFFRARIVPNEKGKAATGDMTGLISAAVCSEATMATDKALRIMENCRKVSSLKWTPLADVPVKNGEGYTFKAGVEYMGIPYGSNWKIPHYIGWHVTPHTFVNAVNDADSIFYHETVSDGEVTAPYYSLVCSSFATMCAGWPYPQPNYAYLYDPMVDVAHSATPVIGELYAHLDPAGSHVVIPERIDRLRNDVAVSAYECVRPVCQRTTRYGKVIKSNNIDVYHVSNGSDYYDEYGYVVHHWLADPDMSVNVPYIDTDDVEIIGGSARPYKGDKSVYTSAEDSVLINIKDTSAANLLITKKGSSEGLGIPINGASQVDVKPYLTGDGIYYVSTNVDPTEESFEYHEVEAIEYSMVNGVPVLKSKDFWYIMFRMSGDYRHKSGIATAQLPADDYSYLIENGATCHYVYSIFRKGEYGAYAVPFKLTEVREDTDNPTTGGAVSDERIAAAVEAYMAENPEECDGVKTVNGNAPDENGNVEITVSGGNVDLTGYAKEQWVQKSFQPKGEYLTNVPVGGETLGGVKNGGNVVINADGSMTAPEPGTPTDEQVNAWFNAHPEATTTVQDGSVSLAKLAPDVTEILIVETIEESTGSSSGSSSDSTISIGGTVAYDLTDNMTNHRMSPVVGETLVPATYANCWYSYITAVPGRTYTVQTATRNSYTGAYVAFTDDDLTVLSIALENTDAVATTLSGTVTAPEGATQLHIYCYTNGDAYTNQMYVTSEVEAGSAEPETPEESKPDVQRVTLRKYVENTLGTIPTVTVETESEPETEPETETGTEAETVSFDLTENASTGYRKNYLYGIHELNGGTASAHTYVDVSNMAGETVTVITAGRKGLSYCSHYAFFVNSDDVVISQFCEASGTSGRTYTESVVVPYGAAKLYISCYRNGYSTAEEILSIASITYEQSGASDSGTTETPETTVVKRTVGEWIEVLLARIEELEAQVNALNGGIDEIDALIGDDA